MVWVWYSGIDFIYIMKKSNLGMKPHVINREFHRDAMPVGFHLLTPPGMQREESPEDNGITLFYLTCTLDARI